MHEAQRLINGTIKAARVLLRTVNKRYFKKKEVFDFMEEYTLAHHTDCFNSKVSNDKRSYDIWAKKDKVLQKWSKK